MGQSDFQADDQTRARLLETARAMVLRGESEFSLTSLCAEAGIDAEDFQKYFEGKTSLMAALAGDAPSKERAGFLRGQMKPADVKLADAAATAFSPLPALSEANSL